MAMRLFSFLAAFVGLLLSKLPASRRKVVIKGPAIRSGSTEQAGKAAFALTLVKFALDFARPALTAWIKKRVTAAPSQPR